jgi:iron complex outermembrane recepter protein
MHGHDRWLGQGVVGSFLLLAAQGGFAAETPARDELESVVISAARTDTSVADLPASVDRIDGARISEGNLQVNLSEALAGVAGVSAQQRQNYAQDLQVSVRGFGARSSFGVRGVRLYTDGIPATMPDGQGQFSHFDLGSAGHIEVLRGPFSVLYGNSSGGVIALYTEEPKAGTALQATVDVGSFDTRRYALKGSVASAAGNSLLVDLGRFTTAGTREHSAATRDTLNARAHWQIGARSSLTLIANAVDLPDAQDPLGLTRAQLTADPYQAGTGAVSFNTRKSVSQQQLGATYDLQFADHARFSFMAYGGGRDTRQYQSIPVATQTATTTHPGGVIDLHRNYRGFDAHASDKYALGAGSLELVAGVAADGLDEARRGYLNFVGTTLGVEGALRRADSNRVYDVDEYLQAQWDSGGRWFALAGVRHSAVDVRSTNELLAGANVSGVRYQATSPVAGLTFRLAPQLRLYGSYGRGFETPTLNDIAYRSTNGSLPGLNLGLVPAHSNHYELGAKAASGPLRATLAAFRIDTTDELAVQSNAAGRSVFANIPSTRRQGAELELQGEWSRYFSSRLAYTWTQAYTTADYGTCTGLPCAAVTVRSGSAIAAVPEHAFGAAATVRAPPLGASLTLEAQLRSRIYVNDLNTDSASGYSLINLHLDLAQRRGAWRFGESLRLDNVFDRSYVGSVIVNESNARYFEPEPGRSVYLMVQVSRAPGR